MADDTGYSEKAARVRAAAQKMYNEAMQETVGLHEQVAEIERQSGKTYEQKLKHAEKLNAGLEAEANLLMMTTTSRRLQIEEWEKYNADLTEAERRQLEFLKEIDGLETAQREDRIRDLVQRQKAADKFNEALQEGIELMAEMEEHAKSIAEDFMGMLGIGKMGHVAKFDKIFQYFSKFAGEGSVKMLAKQFFSFENAQRGVNSVLDKFIDATIKSMFAQTDAEAKLASATGGLEKYNRVLASSRAAGIGMAVSFDEQQESISGLFEGMSSFSELNAGMQSRLSLTATAMGRLGVSSGLFAGNMNELTKTFGMSTKEAEEFSVRMASMGRAIGVSASKITKDWSDASPRLQLFGKNMERVFTNLQKTAKATGASMGSLFSLARGFDTFGDAQDKVNKLNQLMGGDYLNSVKLVSMADDERIDYLRERLRAGGLLGKNMDHLTKKAIMAVVGEEGLNAILKEGNTSQEERIKIQKKAAKALETEKARKQMMQLMSAATKALPLFEQMMRQIQNALSDEGLLGEIKDLWKHVSKLLVKFKDFRNEHKLGILQILGYGFALKLLLGVLGSVAKVAGAKAASSIGGLGSKMLGASKSAGGMAKNVASSAKNTLAMGAAFLMAGIGIGAAALGLAEFVKAFKGLTGTEQQAALKGMLFLFGGFIVAMIAGTAVMSKLGPKAALAALIFLGLGAGIALAAVGMAYFMEGVAASLPIIAQHIDALERMALAVGGMALALGFLGASAMMFALPIGLLAAALGAVALALQTVPEWAEAAISHVIVNTSDVVTLAANVGAGMIAQATGQAAPSPAGGGGAVATGGAGVGTAGPTTVVLEIDKREFARAVVNTLNGRIRLGDIAT